MYCYDVPIRCSFDPNDKMVNPMRAENYTLFNEDLIYTIRFQNTGNDLAYRVVISDTLDPKLDWSSLQVLNSSHQEHLATDVSENGIITFSFENIRLPFEKQDKEGSNGFVSYKIKSIANVPEKVQYKILPIFISIIIRQFEPILHNLLWLKNCQHPILKQIKT